MAALNTINQDASLAITSAKILVAGYLTISARVFYQSL